MDEIMHHSYTLNLFFSMACGNIREAIGNKSASTDISQLLPELLRFYDPSNLKLRNLNDTKQQPNFRDDLVFDPTSVCVCPVPS